MAISLLLGGRLFGTGVGFKMRETTTYVYREKRGRKVSLTLEDGYDVGHYLSLQNLERNLQTNFWRIIKDTLIPKQN